MEIAARVRHAKLLVEHLKQQVEAQQEKGKTLKYFVTAQVTLPKGVLTDSETKSFLAALEGALSKFNPDDPCPIKLFADVIAEEQVEIQQALEESFGKAMQLEQDLALTRAESLRSGGRLK